MWEETTQFSPAGSPPPPRGTRAHRGSKKQTRRPNVLEDRLGRVGRHRPDFWFGEWQSWLEEQVSGACGVAAAEGSQPRGASPANGYHAWQGGPAPSPCSFPDGRRGLGRRVHADVFRSRPSYPRIAHHSVVLPNAFCPLKPGGRRDSRIAATSIAVHLIQDLLEFHYTHHLKRSFPAVATQSRPAARRV